MALVYAGDLITWLISHYGYQSYLEIGCNTNFTFNMINCPIKVGVDPEVGGTLRMTSDEFFEKNDDGFDLIFIDGDHHHRQVYIDIVNSLEVLNENGTIVMHDCSPIAKHHELGGGNGTCWRAFAKFRSRPGLVMAVSNFNHGVGVIWHGESPGVVNIDKEMDELTYEDLAQNREQWLNLLRPHQTINWIKQHKKAV